MSSKSVDAKAALRQLMKQEKQKRIDSPLAKYTSTGQLLCALCNQSLTSETFWKAHVNGREHKQKLLELKSNIKQSNTEPVFAKPFPPSPAAPAAGQQQRGIKRSHDVAAASDSIIVGKSSTPTAAPVHSSLPADFFDTGASKSHIEVKPVVAKSTVASAPGALPEESSALPEGFFDDPQMDARMRKVEYVDRMEVEWDMFTREMKQEANISEKLEATDDIERDVERDIKEATELISRWQKIEEMHDMKDSRFKAKHVVTKKPTVMNRESAPGGDDNDDDDDDEESLEQELQGMYNWRQKRS